MSVSLSSTPLLSLPVHPRMRHQQLRQQLRALQTTFQTYSTAPTTQTLTRILPALHTHTSQLATNLPHLSPPLLLPVLPTLLDVLDAVSELPLSLQVQPLVADVLSVLVWWSKGAERWLRSVEDKGSEVYVEVSERVREGYVRLGTVAEQWAAAVTLSTSSKPSAANLLPPLLTSLTLSLPYLSPAPRDSSLDLLVSSLSSSSTCVALLSSPHLVDLLTALPAALSSSTPARVLTVTQAVLSLWRRGDVTGVRNYDEYRAIMSYTAGVSALLKQNATDATQLQQICTTAAESSASVASLSLFALFGVVGMLHALDPKAAVYKRHREEAAAVTERVDSLTVNTTTPTAASTASPSATPLSSTIPSSADAATTSIHLSTILALQSSLQSTVDRLITSCSTPSAAMPSISAPSFAASQCGILSAVCVNGVEWLQWSDALFTFVTGAFLTLVDTRWCIAAFSSSSSASAASASRNDAAAEWVRSSFFSLLPHYSRAFSVLFLRAPTPQSQCEALRQVRHRMCDIQRQWQRYNRVGLDTDTLQQQGVTTAMEEDSAADEEDESADDTKADDSTSSELYADSHNNTPQLTLSATPAPPAPSTTQPLIDKHTLSELQNTLFLSVCMALATVCKPSLLSALPVSAVCDVVDTLSWLEYVRVNFTAYRDVVLAVVNEGLRREALDVQQATTATRERAKEMAGSEKQPGWLSWLIGWRRHKRRAQQLHVAEDTQPNGSRPSPQSSELVHTYLHSYLLPSIISPVSASAPSSVPVVGVLFASSTLTALSVDESDVVTLSRHYFLLGLLSEWQDSCTASDALTVLLPYSASFVHCRVRGVLKRAHGLLVRSLALLVRHHSLQPTDEAKDGYGLFLTVLLPYTRLALSQYPLQLGLPTLMDSLVLLFHLLPSDHPLLRDASHAIVDRIQQLTDRAVTSALSPSTAAAAVALSAGGDSLQVPTSLRHLLILHFQLIQLLSLPSFRSALSRTGGLFPGAVVSGGVVGGGGVYGGMLAVLRDVIVRNFDLYRRDEAVRWWMAVKQRSGIVLAVPAPPPPLPIAAPSITTVKPTT